PFGRPGLAADIVVEPGHDPQQGRLAGAVEAEHPDLRPGQEAEPDIVEHLAPARIDLGQALHDADVLIGGHWRSHGRLEVGGGCFTPAAGALPTARWCPSVSY